METVPLRSYAEENRRLAEAFDRYMVSRGLSQQTRRSYRDSIGRIIEMLGSQSVLETSRADLRRLLASLVEKGLSANSIALHTAGLRAFYKFLRMAELMSGSDPTLRLAHRKQPYHLQNVLTAEEIERAIAAAKNPLERAILETLYGTGVRVSELVSIRLENVDFAHRTIMVRKGKGGKDRLVLFGQKCADALADYLGNRREGFLFEHGATHPYSAISVRVRLHAIGCRANVPGLHPHAVRRALATHMLASGASIRAVQELLGHEFLHTTQRYTLLSAADLQSVYEKAHPHAKGESA